MNFSPVLPVAGYAGWAFLKRTLPAQTAAYQANPATQRDEAYFRERIGKIDTAEQLVSDKRLLRVALQAFGLEGDVNNTYFIRKVLEDGTLKSDALSSRLADKQYQKLSAAFGFGDFAVPRTKLSDFADKMIGQVRGRGFEAAVGAQDGNLRLALNAEREVALLAKSTISEDAKWFSVMGSVPLRTVFEKALGLPGGFSLLDIDQQLSTLKTKAEQSFGADSIAQFAGPEKLDQLIRRFLLRAEVDGVLAQSAQSGALQMMQQAVDFARRR